MIRRPARLVPLLVCALLAGAVLPLAAQKSTIQGSRGSSAGTSRPSALPRAGIARPGGSGGTGTLSPGFPRKGRIENPGGIASRPPSAPRGAAPRVLRPAGGDRGKGYIRRPEDRSEGDRRGHDFIDRDGRRRHRDGVSYIVYDPFFYDPYYRYRHFDRYRYAYGLGCGYYDPFFLGYGGRRWGYRYDPCFSSFSVALGYPWFVDPWPGFWGWGYSSRYGWQGTYGYGGDSPSGYAEEGYGGGYDEGFSRGYEEGQRRAGEGAGYDGDYRSQLAPGVQPAYGEEYVPGAGLPVDPAVRGLLARGDYAAAVEELDALLDDYPQDAAAHLTRGIALVALGHYGKAADAFRDGLDTGRPVPLRLDAPALFPSRAEFRRALRGLEGWVRNHADSRDARFALGALYLFSGETDKGRALLRGLPDDPHARALLDRSAFAY